MDIRAALAIDTMVMPEAASQITSVAMPAIDPIAPPIVAPVDISVNIPAMPKLPDRPAMAGYTGDDLTAVGDSVLLGSSGLLAATLKGADIHATVGWQAADVLNQFKTLSQDGHLRSVVLVHLGTNGYITEDQLRQILSLLTSAKRVILVNTHVPRRWMDVNNALIDQVAADYRNVVVVDWRGVSDGHPNYFVADGVHLNTMGQRVFIAEIMRKGHLVPTAEDDGMDTKVATAAKLASLAHVDMRAARFSSACLTIRPVSVVLKGMCQPPGLSPDSGAPP
jgi:hypothetical protein